MARHKRRRTSSAPVRVEARAGGGLALLVGGVTQSITLADDAPAAPDAEPSESQADQPAAQTPTTAQPRGHHIAADHAHRPRYGYWELMLPASPNVCPRSALLLGLGGGTIAALLARRCPTTQMIGVERDETVLATAYAELGLGDIPRLAVVVSDAFTWVAAQANSSAADHYDLICLDLFEGGRLALGALGTPFLRQVGALLAPGGLLTVNLLANARTPGYLRRLETVFTVERVAPLYGNRVVHCRQQRG